MLPASHGCDGVTMLGTDQVHKESGKNASKMDDKLSYCWWVPKSCTTKDHDYPTIHRVEQPSQVVVWDFVHQQYDKLIDKYCETPRVMEDRCNLGLPEILCGHDLFEVSAAV